jgi:hypothetical protein
MGRNDRAPKPALPAYSTQVLPSCAAEVWGILSERCGQINLMISLISEDLADLVRSSEFTRRFIRNLSPTKRVERRVLPDRAETSPLGTDLWLHRRDPPSMCEHYRRREGDVQTVGHVGSNLIDALDELLERRPHKLFAMAGGMGMILATAFRRQRPSLYVLWLSECWSSQKGRPRFEGRTP